MTHNDKTSLWRLHKAGYLLKQEAALLHKSPFILTDKEEQTLTTRLNQYKDVLPILRRMDKQKENSCAQSRVSANPNTYWPLYQRKTKQNKLI